MKKLLSLDDLYSFYENQGTNCNFNAKDSDSTIYVQVEEKVNFSNDYDPDTYKLKTKLKACHLGLNRNGSSISEEAMKEAIPSFYNAPILGYIHKLKDGSYDFAGHEADINEDGEFEYKEIPVGVIPESCDAKLVYDEDNDKTYLEVNGIIFKEYTKAAEILEQKGTSKVSVELAVDELSYSADSKVLNIERFHFTGITILGCTDDNEERQIEEGMYGSNISLMDFSAENNSICTNAKLVETLEKLYNTLSKFDINNSMKGEEDKVDTEKIEEVTDTEEKFSEDVEVAEETTEEVTVEEEFSEDTEETPEVEENFEDSTVEEETVEEFESEEDTVKFSVTRGEFTKEFSLSINDKLSALYTLVNDTYSEQDGDFYDVVVYEDEKVVESHGFFTGKSYRQSYKCKKNSFSLVGDRIEVFCKYMTEDEIAAFEKLKADFSSTSKKLSEVEEKLAKYEAEPEKIEVLSSDDYKKVVDTEEFAELKKRETYFDMSVEDIKSKADQILLDYAKSGKLDFSVKEEKKAEEKPSMFAFAKVEQTSSFLDGLLKK